MTAPLVLHVLPYDLARGAQIYAKALRDRLDHPGCRHRIVTLFAPVDAVLDADFALDVPIGLGRRLGFSPRVAAALHRLVREERPSVLVAHGSEPLKYCCVVSRAADRALPVACYRIGVSALRGGPRLKLMAAQLRAADVVAGVSDEVLDESVELFGVDRERCVLIPNGRDPACYQPAEKPVPGPPRVIFVGHYDANKRPEVVVQVIAGLRAAGVDVAASMIGDGPLLDAIRPSAEAAGIDVLGRRSDVPDLLRTGAVFLLVSRMEGMPGVFIEAGLSGLPTVTTDVPGAHSVIENGVTGFIVPQDDTEALVLRVGELLTDAPLARKMGSAARARCLESFTLERGAGLWGAILERLIEGSRG